MVPHAQGTPQGSARLGKELALLDSHDHHGGSGRAPVYLHGIDSNPILAFNIGASAPFILTSLTDQAPKVGPGRSESD